MKDRYRASDTHRDVLSMSRDITNRELAQKALLESEERYRTAIENCNDGVIMGSSGEIVFCNRRTVEMFGYDSAEEILSSGPFPIVHPSDLDKVRQLNRDRLAGKAVPEKYEFQGVKKDGSPINIEASVAKVTVNGAASSLVYLRDITYRIKAEQALHESEEKYRNMFENAVEGVFRITPDGRRILANPALARMYGYDSPEEFMSETTVPVKFYVDPRKREELLEAHREKDMVTDFEVHRYCKDGSTIWVSITARTVRDATGNIMYYEGRVIDITKRKMAEEALRESEERHRIVVKQTGQLIYDVDIATGLVKRTGAITEITGYAPDEFQGDVNRWKDSIHPKDRASVVNKIFHSKRQGGNAYCVEYRVRRKDGAYVLIEDRGSYLKDGRGNAYRVLGAMENISERKRVTDELKESKEELKYKTRTLEELNTALKVLLRQGEDDRKSLEERFVSNTKELILPYVEKIKKGILDPQQRSFLNVLEANIHELVSPFLHTMKQLNLTRRETQAASLIKDGKSTREIADILGVAPSAIDSYRSSIRSKLGLTNNRANLQSYLKSLS